MNLNLSLTDLKSMQGLSAVFSELSGNGWGHLRLCLFSAKVALRPIRAGWVCAGWGEEGGSKCQLHLLFCQQTAEFIEGQGSLGFLFSAPGRH